MLSIIKSKKGFTLIELLAVIAIMGVILGVAIPATGGIMVKSRQKECVSSQEMVKQKVYDYLNGNYLGLENSLSWKAGSYNPNTDTWEDVYAHWSNKDYIYYYNTSAADTSQKVGCTPGEHFLRYAYNLGPTAPAVFPAGHDDGCKVYIAYVDTQATSYYGRSPLSPQEMSALRAKGTYIPSGYVEIRCTNENHKPKGGWLQIPNV
ncbi:MAG: type II secretion system protein [Oscillospiraceae bacterium]